MWPWCHRYHSSISSGHCVTGHSIAIGLPSMSSHRIATSQSTCHWFLSPPPPRHRIPSHHIATHHNAMAAMRRWFLSPTPPLALPHHSIASHRNHRVVMVVMRCDARHITVYVSHFWISLHPKINILLLYKLKKKVWNSPGWICYVYSSFEHQFWHFQRILAVSLES